MAKLPWFVLVLGLLSLALTFLCFGHTLGHWFTDLDMLALVHESHVRSPSELFETLTKPLAGGRSGGKFFRPTTHLVLAALRGWFGWEADGYNIFRLLVHALNAALTGALAALIAARLKAPRPQWTGLAAALVFAVHPLGEEIVPAGARIGDLLVTAFGLMTLLLIDRWAGVLDRRGPLLLVLASIALTVGAKESGVVVVVAAPLYLALIRWDVDPEQRRRNVMRVALGGGFVLAAFLLVRVALLGEALGGYHQAGLAARLHFVGRVSVGFPVDLLVPGHIGWLAERLPSGAGQLLMRSWPALLALALVAYVTGLRWRRECGPGARLANFTVCVLGATAALYVATATYERRYLYSAVPHLALVLAAALVWPAPRRQLARFGSAVLIVLLLSQSPLFHAYSEWRGCSEVCRLLTEGSRQEWENLPDGAYVYLMNMPASLSLDPMRRDPLSLLGASSTRPLSYYSLDAWLEAQFPNKTLHLVQLGSMVYRVPPHAFRHHARVADGRLWYRTPEATLELEPLSDGAARAYRGDARNGDEKGFRLRVLSPRERALSYEGVPAAEHAYVVTFDGHRPKFTPVRELHVASQ